MWKQALGSMILPWQRIQIRIVTDWLAEYLITTTEWASANPVRMDVSGENILFVGVTMIDNLIQNLNMLKSMGVWERDGLPAKTYYVLSLYRASNVDARTIWPIFYLFWVGQQSLKDYFPGTYLNQSKTRARQISWPVNRLWKTFLLFGIYGFGEGWDWSNLRILVVFRMKPPN